jgi:hypothetical protein
MTGDFIHYRRNMNYYNCKETPVGPLIDQLGFMKNKTSRGTGSGSAFLKYRVRF